MKRLLAALLALMMLLTMTSCAAPDAAETDDKLTLVAFNVGKADALLLTSGDTAYLIDTGTEDSWTDLSRALEALGVTHLTGVIVTHMDKDHYGGAKQLAESDIAIDGWYASWAWEKEKWKKHPVVKAAAVRGEEITLLKPGDTLSDGLLSIFWDYSIKNLADKTFWKDLTHRFTNWVITQVPSIIILTLIFIGLLRLLNYIVKKLNKAAKRRVHLNENIDDAEGNKRIETLSGIILGVGKIFLWTIFVLIMLSKFNINIGPILASAGIVGLAVGFGAQELVRDFISGFFILLEDQIRTGDVAIINGTTGTVEKIEMRTTTLRDASGVVHIFQNGKINSLSNMTKGWSAIVVDIGVAYKEDTDHVNEIMKQVGDELMKDAAWQSILMGVDLWGVDSFGDSSVILKVKLTTKSGQQWAASREFRRRIKKAFDAQHIEIPFPQVSLNTGSGTGAMPVKIES